MLRNTFQHIRGMGSAEELTLWRHGVLRWEQVERLRFNLFSAELMQRLRVGVKESVDALARGDVAFFMESLSAGLLPRLVPEFGKRMCYVDIETTGLDLKTDSITTVTALYQGCVHTYVRGRDFALLPDALPRGAVIVSFNGKSFDLPFLLKEFGRDIMRLHIDLVPVLKAWGFTGSLKAVERSFGIMRTEPEGITGAHAVKLWDEYEAIGNASALAQLTAYSRRDTLSLAEIMTSLYGDTMRGFPERFCSLTTEKPNIL